MAKEQAAIEQVIRAIRVVGGLSVLSKDRLKRLNENISIQQDGVDDIVTGILAASFEQVTGLEVLKMH